MARELSEPDPARTCGGAGPIRQRFFAWFMARHGHKADRYLAPYKSRLFAEASGLILEIGPGAGVNLRHFATKRVRWIGVEPNSYMNPHLAEEAVRLRMRIEVLEATAEELPIRSASIDCVISTLVLCSVIDQRRALSEIVRVLKPGAKLIFIEHVAAPSGTFLRGLQTAVRPLWRRIVDGCHPDRDTRAAIERSGLTIVELDKFGAPLPVVRPHIAGYAIKPISDYEDLLTAH